MTYSQLLYRVVAFAIAVAACWLLVTDRLCMLSTNDGCRPVHGPAAVAVFFAALSIAAFLVVASTQPRKGQRAVNLMVTLVAFLVCYLSAFFLDLFWAR
jgi:acyl-CoA synthetase (AMP-forming)/AMP-acid ligase II